MADESMRRTLAAQSAAIWPQEAPLFDRYGTPKRILDVGCGSGEITRRLAERYPDAEILGIDMLEGPLTTARERCAPFGARVEFAVGDAFALGSGDAEIDLVVCRHVTQAVPDPEKLLAELWRVCRPGGWLHLLSEDYEMLHFPVSEVDPARLFREGLHALSVATGVDERVGRRTWGMLERLGPRFLQVDYAVVDTLRVPRETFAGVLIGWRDGYSTLLDEHAHWTAGEARRLFDDIIAKLLDRREYAVWFVPLFGAQKG